MVEDDSRGPRTAAQPWAARPDDLLRTDLCPACQEPLGSLVCSRCGLDVRAPEAPSVLDASRRIVESIAERERLLASMRTWGEAAARAREAAASAPADATGALAGASPSVADDRRLTTAVGSEGSAPVAASRAEGGTTVGQPARVEPFVPVGPPASGSSPGAVRDEDLRPSRVPVGTPPSRPQPAEVRRRISVPAVLLAVGVVLLSVAAVFYVVYAFVTYGLVVRAAITAAVTVAAFAAASLLARRRLPGTAEAVGAVGVVLLHLDVWAVRSYDLWGAGSNDPFVHFGVGTLVVSAALLALRPVLRIRTAGIAGWAGLTVGVGLLVGAVPSTDAGTRTALALAAASIVALVHAAPRSPRLALPDASERGILRVVGVIAATAALVAGAASALDPAAVPALPLLVAAVASGAHAWALARSATEAGRREGVGADAVAFAEAPAGGTDAPGSPARSDGVVPDVLAGADGRPPAAAPSDPLRVLAAAVAGSGAAAALPVTALTGGPALLAFCGQLVAAALVAGALDVAAHRLRAPLLVGTTRIAAIAAVVVAALAGLSPLVVGLGGVVATVAVGLPAWQRAPLDDAVALLGRTTGLADPPGDVRWAALGLVVVWIIAGVAAGLGGRLRPRGVLLAWTGAAAVVVAVPALGPVVVVAVAYLLVSAAALAVRLSSRKPSSPASRRAVVPAAPLLALSLTAGTLAWAASWASAGTWWAVTPVVILLLVAGARTARTDDTARLATVGAALAGLVTAGALAPSLTAARVLRPTPISSALDAAADPVVLVLLGSALVVLVAGALPARPGVRRRALLATVLLPACATALVVAIVGAGRVGGALTGSPVWPITAQVILVAGLAAWTVGGLRRRPLPARAPREDAPAIAPRPAGTTALRRWRLTTAGLVAPALLLAVLTAGALVERGTTPHGTVPAAVALVVACSALPYRGASRALRVALDVGTATVAVGALLVAVSSGPAQGDRELLWLPLLLLAAAALVLSIAHDGLLLSRSARRAWGWTSFGVAIAALWSRLLATGATSSEAYWLPVAGVLLLLAASMHRAALRADADGADHAAGPRVRRGVSALTLAGILTAVLPLAGVGQADEVLRPTLLIAISAALALASAVVLRRAPSPVRPLLRAVVIAGGIGILVVGGTRALRLAGGQVDRAPAIDLQLAITAALLVAVGALTLRGARSPADSRIAGSAWAAATAVVVAGMSASVGSGEGVVRPLVASVILVAGAGVLLVLRSVHRSVLAMSAAVALIGAVVVALLAWRGGYTPVEPAALAVPAVVAVLVAAVGAADRLRNPHPARLPAGASSVVERVVRHASDGATGVLVVGTVAVGAIDDAAGLPAGLLLSGVAVLVASSGGGSRARRRMGWVALVLGSAALWVALGRGHVDDVEPYVLPPAGVMLLVAALLHRGLPGGRRPQATAGAVPARESGAAPVLLGALLLAALPTAVASWTGTPVRALLVGSAAGVALILAAAALRGAGAAWPLRYLLLSTAAASAITVPLVGFGRTVAQLDADAAATFGRTDIWTLTAGLVLVLAVALLPALPTDVGAIVTRARGESSDPVGGRDASDAPSARAATASAVIRTPSETLLRAAPRIVVLVALVGTATAGTAAILRARFDVLDGVGARSALLVGLVALLHIVCSPAAPVATETERDGDPSEVHGPAVLPLQDRALAVAAIVAAGGVALILAVTGAADPVEAVTVPIAAALIAAGARRLLRDPSAGSMRHLAPGLVVLLGPSLAADLGPNPAWRIVGLGVLALGTLLAGARLRLRAPFLIGAAVLLAHAVAQLWPWIRAASATVPWWAWAGIGGILLIAVAARYERRIRDLKAVAARVSALR